MIHFQNLIDTVNSMPVDHHIRLTRQDMTLAIGRFPGRFGSPKDYFLSHCIGSAYGVVRWYDSTEDGDIIISKHAAEERPDGALYHVDADRQHLFDRGADGLWRRT